jgi:hypothetical protein
LDVSFHKYMIPQLYVLCINSRILYTKLIFFLEYAIFSTVEERCASLPLMRGMAQKPPSNDL